MGKTMSFKTDLHKFRKKLYQFIMNTTLVKRLSFCGKEKSKIAKIKDTDYFLNKFKQIYGEY